MEPIDTSNTEHYTWGDQCDGWHFLKTDTLSIIRESMPPGTSEKMHYHTHAQQFFYILSGTASFEINKQYLEVKQHTGIHIPKGTAHKISNLTTESLEFLVISEPKAHGDRSNLE